MIKKVVYLKDLVKVAGKEDSYEYHVVDSNVEEIRIRIRKYDMPSESVNVHCVRIIDDTNTSEAPSVSVLCDRAGTIVKVHSYHAMFKSVNIFNRYTNTIISAKAVNNLIYVGRTIYDANCEELTVVDKKFLKVCDSTVENLYSTDRVVINNSIIGNANIESFEVDNQTHIKYVNDKKVLSFTYNENIIMSTEDSLFINGKGCDIGEKDKAKIISVLEMIKGMVAE